MRLNKILADAGVASRRGAEALLAAGRVAVNGAVVTEPGAQADPARDTITLDGRPLPAASTRPAYIMLNKPTGTVTTASDPQGRPTALALVDRPERLFYVGRLDRDTEGLLLLTNDGEWANRVTHPSGGVEKEYEALVDGVPDEAALQRMEEGVELPDGHIAHGRATVLEVLDGQARVSLTLHEGHKRQARFMFGALGYPVRRLLRVREGGLDLGDLPPGTWRELTAAEVAAVTRPQRREPRRESRDMPSGARPVEQVGAIGGRESGDRRGRGPYGYGGERERDRAQPRDGRGDGAAGTRPREQTHEWRDDDRDRRPGGLGQVDDRPRRGPAPEPALPRHGRDVSRGDVAGSPRGDRPRR